MCVFLISPVPIAEPLMSELIDTPVFHNLAPRPIKYQVSVPIPNGNPYLEFVFCIYPIQSAHTHTHTAVNTHIHREHTPGEVGSHLGCGSGGQ